jgi:hypothetical protein
LKLINYQDNSGQSIFFKVINQKLYINLLALFGERSTLRMEEKHDIHDFLISAKRDMQDEYDRIIKRATEDPGTAEDQGEENWATN